MANVALIDDDLTEAMVLEGMLAHCEGEHILTHFRQVEVFPESPDNNRFDLVLIDRRIPPHAGFETSLPVLAASGYQGPVIPISAGPLDAPVHDGLRLIEPIMKSELLTPEAVAAFVERIVGMTRP